MERNVHIHLILYRIEISNFRQNICSTQKKEVDALQSLYILDNIKYRAQLGISVLPSFSLSIYMMNFLLIACNLVLKMGKIFLRTTLVFLPVIYIPKYIRYSHKNIRVPNITGYRKLIFSIFFFFSFSKGSGYKRFNPKLKIILFCLLFFCESANQQQMISRVK